MLTVDTILQIHPEVIITELDSAPGNKEAVLLHLTSKQYFSLNDTGLYIWRRLEERQSLGAVAECLTAEYEVGAEQAQQSVLDLAQALFEKHLIEVVPSASS